MTELILTILGLIGLIAIGVVWWDIARRMPPRGYRREHCSTCHDTGIVPNGSNDYYSCPKCDAPPSMAAVRKYWRDTAR